MQIANDWTPPSRPSPSARERALRHAMHLRGRLRQRARMTDDQRTYWANEYEQAAMRCAALGQTYPDLIELAGMYSTSAKILRAED